MSALSNSVIIAVINRNFRRPCIILIFSYIVYKKKLLIKIFVTGILGGLVGITGKLMSF